MQVVSALLCGSWQDFNWHDALRGPSAIAELLVTCLAAGVVELRLQDDLDEVGRAGDERLGEPCRAAGGVHVPRAPSQRSADVVDVEAETAERAAVDPEEHGVDAGHRRQRETQAAEIAGHLQGQRWIETKLGLMLRQWRRARLCRPPPLHLPCCISTRGTVYLWHCDQVTLWRRLSEDS